MRDVCRTLSRRKRAMRRCCSMCPKFRIEINNLRKERRKKIGNYSRHFSSCISNSSKLLDLPAITKSWINRY